MPLTSLSLPSFAKINLGLKVLGKRGDGYHDICTVFQTISLYDTLDFVLSDELTLSCNRSGIPTDGRNLILKAATELLAISGTTLGAEINLTKRIPSPGGLGGGSSNAAVALIGLSRLWDLRINLPDMGTVAAKLGSDVPFFLRGGTALGTGRGTEIEPLSGVSAPNILLICPNINVSTTEAFAGLDARNLTTEDSNRILQICRFKAKTHDFRVADLENDFEQSVFRRFPEIERAKQTLIELGAQATMMSGSGASVYGIFDKEETRQTALKALDNEINWRKFAVATLSRDQYEAALF
ncbi:MAG: 4-(cytidine 5'-diphospho)-2-C-methyl-D-erythritol kinase [Acidobacteriota bacterium]